MRARDFSPVRMLLICPR